VKSIYQLSFSEDKATSKVYEGLSSLRGVLSPSTSKRIVVKSRISEDMTEDIVRDIFLSMIAMVERYSTEESGLLKIPLVAELEDLTYQHPRIFKEKSPLEGLESPASCSHDLKNFCFDVDEGTTVRDVLKRFYCLKRVFPQSQVSANCRADIGFASFSNECAVDVELFCGDGIPGDLRVHRCLSSHSNALSQSCSKYFNAVANSHSHIRLEFRADAAPDFTEIGKKLKQVLSSYAGLAAFVAAAFAIVLMVFSLMFCATKTFRPANNR